MDWLTQPTWLDLNASSPSASREWRHWFKTFENYIEVLDASLAEERRIDRLKALVNSVSHQVFEYIEESAAYEAAIAKLQDLYIKVPNEVFARHLLATTKQQSGQTLEFLLSLQKLARDCNFRTVSGNQYKEMIHDASIIGLVSHGIRQRLLENRELHLKNAVEKARAMELAQKNSEFYSNIPESRNNLAAASRITNLCNDDGVSKDSLCPSISVNKQETASSVSKICSFCGRPYHLRSLCPVRNATCYKCQKGTSQTFASPNLLKILTLVCLILSFVLSTKLLIVWLEQVLLLK